MNFTDIINVFFTDGVWVLGALMFTAAWAKGNDWC